MKADELRRLVDYFPDTGRFVWRSRDGETRADRIFNTKYAGRPAGCDSTRGYAVIKINQTSYMVHRLVWLYVTGEWPDQEIDHINKNTHDNRWVNLRAASRSENGANRGVHKNNKSGAKGVYWSESKKKWVAQAGGKKNRIITYAETMGDAVSAYKRSAVKIYGAYARSV